MMFSFSLLSWEPKRRRVVFAFAAYRGCLKSASDGLTAKSAAVEPSWPVDGQACEEDD